MFKFVFPDFPADNVKYPEYIQLFGTLGSADTVFLNTIFVKWFVDEGHQRIGNDDVGKINDIFINKAVDKTDVMVLQKRAAIELSPGKTRCCVDAAGYIGKAERLWYVRVGFVDFAIFI